jgi:hypothetical protein
MNLLLHVLEAQERAGIRYSLQLPWDLTSVIGNAFKVSYQKSIQNYILFIHGTTFVLSSSQQHDKPLFKKE